MVPRIVVLISPNWPTPREVVARLMRVPVDWRVCMPLRKHGVTWKLAGALRWLDVNLEPQTHETADWSLLSVEAREQRRLEATWMPRPLRAVAFWTGDPRCPSLQWVAEAEQRGIERLIYSPGQDEPIVRHGIDAPGLAHHRSPAQERVG